MGSYHRFRLIAVFSVLFLISCAFFFLDFRSRFVFFKYAVWRCLKVVTPLYSDALIYDESKSYQIVQDRINRNEKELYKMLYTQVLSDNHRLKNILNTSTFYSHKNVVTAVVDTFEVSSFLNKIWVNKGSINGVQKYDPVMGATEKKVYPLGVVGYVVKVLKDKSQIILISDPSCFIVVSFNDLSCLLKGAGYFKSYVDYLDIDTEIEQNRLVTTSPYSKIFPSGLLIGYAIKSSLMTGKNEFQRIKVQPLVALNSLREVMILSQDKKI